MSPTKKLTTATAADLFYAAEYERLYSAYLGDGSLVASICAFFREKITPSGTILIDLGCGVGAQLKDIAATLSIPASQCLGIDISPSMQERFEKTWGDSKPDFWQGDFLEPSFAKRFSELVAVGSPVSNVVILCLGNTIGLVKQESYSRMADLANAFPSTVNVFFLFEYRDGIRYRALCPIGEIDEAAHQSPESFGSAEVIGQHEADYFAFYIRTHVDEARYSVNLFALSMEPTDDSTKCAIRGMYIENGYYVDATRLENALRPTGFAVDSQFRATSALEAGETIMFYRQASNG